MRIKELPLRNIKKRGPIMKTVKLTRRLCEKPKELRKLLAIERRRARDDELCKM